MRRLKYLYEFMVFNLSQCFMGIQPFWFLLLSKVVGSEIAESKK